MKKGVVEYLNQISSIALPELPSGHDKTIEAFYSNCVEPLLPKPETVEKWHELLVRYSEDSDAIFFVRKYGSAANRNWTEIRRGFLTEYRDKAGYVFCDNYFAHYFFVMAFHGYVPAYSDFNGAIRQRAFPYGARLTQEELPFQAYPKGQITKLNSCGWKLAHLFSVNGSDYSFDYKTISTSLFPRGERTEWTRDDEGYPRRRVNREMSKEERDVLRAHFLRLVHPINHFLVPKSANERDRFGNNIGENGSVLSYVYEQFKMRYANIIKEYESLVFGNSFNLSTADLFIGAEVIDIYYGKDRRFSQPDSASQISSTKKDEKKKRTSTAIGQDEVIEMCRLYLEEGLSFRALEKRVLHIDSQNRGGGFIAKKAVNDFGITNENKGALVNNSLVPEYEKASGRYRNALEKLYPELVQS